MQDRLTEIDADHCALSALLLADAPAKMTYTYNALGQRLTAQTLNTRSQLLYSESLAYDSLNRLISKTPVLSSSNGPLSTLNYGYDSQGNLATISSSHISGAHLTYIYDSLNRLQTVTAFDPQTSTTQATDYTYDTVGNLESVTRPNDVTSLYTYDNLNRLTALSVSKGLPTLASYAYTLDSSGHRTTVTELNGRVHTYAYDNLYRLTSETIAAGVSDPGSIAGAVGYALDKVGNRLSRSSSVPALSPSNGPSVVNSSFDSNDRLTSDTYDANGNTLTAPLNPDSSHPGSFQDVYDFQNHLIRRTRADASSTIDLCSTIATATASPKPCSLRPPRYPLRQAISSIRTIPLATLKCWKNGPTALSPGFMPMATI